MEPHEGNMDERIELYLSGRMEPAQKEAFEQEVLADPVLKDELEFQKTLKGAIRYARHQELKEYLREEVAGQRHNIKVLYSVISIAAVVVLAAVVSFFYMQPVNEKYAMESEENQYHDYAHHTSDTLTVYYPPGYNNNNSLALAAKPAPALDLRELQQGIQENEPALSNENWQQDASAFEFKRIDTENIVFSYTPPQPNNYSLSAPKIEAYRSEVYKKADPNARKLTDTIAADRIIGDTIVPVLTIQQYALIYEDLYQARQVTTRQSTGSTQLLKKEKALKDAQASSGAEEKKGGGDSQGAKAPASSQDKDVVSGRTRDAWAESLKVEYWKSPINYKGYKLHHNTLVIFGMAPAEKILIIHYLDDYYLRSPRQLYKLEEHEEFNAFIPVKDPELLKKMGF